MQEAFVGKDVTPLLWLRHIVTKCSLSFIVIFLLYKVNSMIGTYCLVVLYPIIFCGQVERFYEAKEQSFFIPNIFAVFEV